MSDISFFLILGLIAGVFSTGYFFERLLMTEYKEFRPDWERDERPFGYYLEGSNETGQENLLE